MAVCPAAFVKRLGAIALLSSAMWTLLGAQQPRAKRGVSWERAREAAGKYRTVLDNSGLVEIDNSLPPNVDAEDLPALCQARERAIEIARAAGATNLSAIGTEQDPVSNERRATAERYLAAISTYVGDVDGAILHFTSARDAIVPWVADYPDLKPRLLGLMESLGVAHLRRGEVQNCLIMSSPDRCVFPLRSGGVHQHQESTRAAADLFGEYLKLQPNDLEVRWLLNVSYMLLGRYPADVPPGQLLAPDLFRSEAPLPRFLDVSGPTKLGRDDVAGGTIAEDFDGDNLVDVFFTSVNYCAPARLYHNRGDGTFEDRSDASGLGGQTGGLNAIQTDYDNDGRPDIFVMRGGWEVAMRNSLLRNNPDGTFTDVTRAAGLSDGSTSTHSIAWADIDNDGWVDVFVGHELSPSQLFRNRGDGTFEDVSRTAGVDRTAFTKGVVFGDYDNDGFADLYVSNMFGDNFLYHNNRNGTFTDVAVSLGVQKPFVSFPTWFFDYDNDGWLDIFVSSYPNSLEEFVKHYVGMPPSAETLTLYHNRGDGTFTNVTGATGLARVVPTMGANFGDLDNDGFLDMYLGTGTPSFGALMPNVMLRNDAGRRFQDVTTATGTGQLQKGHGIAFVDIDNDGDEDVVLNSGGAVPGDQYTESLFENPGNGNNWIAVRLTGVKTNRAAIGAKVRVTLPDTSSGSALRFREVTSGGSFGATTLLQHIGIGKAASIPKLEIIWPVSQTVQVFHNVPLNTVLSIRELDERFTVVSPPRVTLAGPSSEK
jgi:hypothetical protein